MLYDPTYVYLISSTNLAQGIGVLHTDHPGSPVQIIGAVIIKFLHFALGTTNDISLSVFRTPESYANSIYIALIILNAIGMFLMGLMIFKKVNNIYVAFIFQLSPLICFSVFRRLTQVSSEVFLVFVLLILIAFLIKFIYELEISPRKMNYYMIVFGVICGLAIVTKLSSVTLLIIPFFLLHGFFRKIMFLVIALITFLATIYPVVSYPQFFIDYTYNTLIKSGRYGKGESNIFQGSVLLQNLQKIFTGEILLSITLVLILVVIIISFFKIDKVSVTKSSKEKNLLLLIFFSIILNIIMVSKNFWSHYLLIVLMLLLPSIYLMISLFKDKSYIKKNYNIIFILIDSLISILILFNSIEFYKKEKLGREESKKFETFLSSNTENTLGIYTFGISNEDLALLFSSQYAGKTMKEYFNKITHESPEFLYYDAWNGRIRSWWITENYDDKEKIKQKLQLGKKLLYYKRAGITPYDTNDSLLNILKVQFGFRNPKLEKIFSNKTNESVYEVILDK